MPFKGMLLKDEVLSLGIQIFSQFIGLLPYSTSYCKIPCLSLIGCSYPWTFLQHLF